MTTTALLAAPPAQLPETAVSVACEYPCGPAAAHEARLLAVKFYGLEDDAVLVVSELSANAALHAAAAPPGTFRVVLSVLRDGRRRVDVYDGSPVLPSPRNVDELAESGRGLCLVLALCESLTASPLPRGGQVICAVLGTPHH